MRPLYGDNIDDVQQIKELIAENQKLSSESRRTFEAGFAAGKNPSGYAATCQEAYEYFVSGKRG